MLAVCRTLPTERPGPVQVHEYGAAKAGRLTFVQMASILSCSRERYVVAPASACFVLKGFESWYYHGIECCEVSRHSGLVAGPLEAHPGDGERDLHG